VVVPSLEHRGFTVRVLTREASRARGLGSKSTEIVVGDVRDRRTLKPALDGVEAVISAMSGYGPGSGSSPQSVDAEGNTSLIHTAAEAGVSHFVLVSVRGAGPDHPMELMRTKFVAEQELKRSGLAWTIIRPTAFMETWSSIVVRPKSERAFVFGRGCNPINFVSVEAVAEAVEKAVVDPSLRGAELQVAGPENLTLNQLAQSIARGNGTRVRVIHIPRSALRILAVAARPVHPALSRLAHDALVMDTFDFAVDVGRLPAQT
jgi:NADH dehydrogenase